MLRQIKQRVTKPDKEQERIWKTYNQDQNRNAENSQKIQQPFIQGTDIGMAVWLRILF